MDNGTILEVRGISKYFPGVKALDNVKLDLRKGTVHALCGENGAGKSTLLKIITGIYQKDEGTITMDGRPIEVNSIADARACGIHVVPQEMQMVPELSVMENIFIGRYPMRGPVVDWKRMQTWAEELKQRLGPGAMALDVRAKVGTLSMGYKQLIEIMRGMIDDNVRVLAFDEPTSSLSTEETRQLFGLIRGMRERGIAIIYVSHRLVEIFEICDEVTVFKDGQYVDTRTVADITSDDIIRMMIGRDIDLFGDRRDEGKIGNDVVLKVDGFCNKNQYKDISFELRKGEILGFYGLVGAGRTEVMRGLFGCNKREAGEVYVNGKKAHIATPKQAMKKGLGFITEDRRTEGLMLEAPLKWNISLTNLDAILNSLHLIDGKKEARYAKEGIRRFSIKTPGENARAGGLSGGNQQKVIIAKWVQRNCDILIFDEPTRGIDVGAKKEVYTVMKRLADEGTSIIMVSSELPEVLGISDRIIVMRDGEITARLKNDALSEEEVLRYAVDS